MREILFRGKRADTKEWIEGDILTSVSYPDKVYITECKTYFDRELSSIGFREVFSRTVGQFTGLCDKKGRKIFEGDIVKFKCYEPTISLKCNIKNINIIQESLIAVNENISIKFGCVKFEDGEFVVKYRSSDGLELYNELIYTYKISEIVGNIFDNPNLLEG